MCVRVSFHERSRRGGDEDPVAHMAGKALHRAVKKARAFLVTRAIRKLKAAREVGDADGEARIANVVEASKAVEVEALVKICLRRAGLGTKRAASLSGSPSRKMGKREGATTEPRQARARRSPRRKTPRAVPCWDRARCVRPVAPSTSRRRAPRLPHLSLSLACSFESRESRGTTSRAISIARRRRQASAARRDALLRSEAASGDAKGEPRPSFLPRLIRGFPLALEQKRKIASPFFPESERRRVSRSLGQFTHLSRRASQRASARSRRRTGHPRARRQPSSSRSSSAPLRATTNPTTTATTTAAPCRSPNSPLRRSRRTVSRTRRVRRTPQNTHP